MDGAAQTMFDHRQGTAGDISPFIVHRSPLIPTTLRIMNSRQMLWWQLGVSGCWGDWKHLAGVSERILESDR